MTFDFAKQFLTRKAGILPSAIFNAAALLLAIFGATTPAQAQTGRVVNAAVGMCLTVSGAIASGSKLMTAVCNNDARNQQFTRTPANELMIGGFCVDAFYGARNGADVGLYPCQNSPNQKWARQSGMLVTTATTQPFCMAVDGGSTAPNIRIITYDCINHPSQKWAEPGPPPSINGKRVYLVNSLGGKCLDVESERTAPNSRLIGYPCGNKLNSQFMFRSNGQLAAYGNSNMCLDKHTNIWNQVDSGVALQPCTYPVPSTQRWKLSPDGTITNGNNMCLMLEGGQRSWFSDALLQSINWQQAVIIAGCDGSGEQKWKPGVLYSASTYFNPIGKVAVGGLATIGNINFTNGASIVAGGGGNIVATDGATVVPSNISNIIAAGGGNIVAAGGGNIVAAGGGNVIAGGAGNITGGAY